MPDYYLLKYLFVKWLHIGPGKKVQLYIYIGNFILFHFSTFRYGIVLISNVSEWNY